MWFSVLCLLWWAASPSTAHAQPSDVAAGRAEAAGSMIVTARAGPVPPTLRAVRATLPIRIDGRLDEPIYAAIAPVSDFVQQEPDEGALATEKTEAWVIFDEDRVIVSARLFESQPSRRIANEMRRDTSQLRQNDTFTVLFDTFHDRRNGYVFTANAIGGLGDSQVTDEGPPNTDWNTVWSAEAADFEGGWTIEIAIPFKSLRYQPGRDQTWGINLRRSVRWKNEWSYLGQVPRALTTFRGIVKVSSAAPLVGLEPPAGSRTIELKPYALSGVTTDNTATPVLANDRTGRVGADLKYGLTENLVADLTVNTDFAQVEVDEQQVNLTRFNLFFPEKRDFFLENLGVFAFAGRASAGFAAGTGLAPYLFFSRRIGLDAGRVVPLDVGGRVTGRAGAYTVGVIAARTGDVQTAGVLPTIEPAAFGVVRVKRDVLRRSSLGGMVTYRSATPPISPSTRTSVSTAIWQQQTPTAGKAIVSATTRRSATTAIATACRWIAWSSSRTSCRRLDSSAAPTCDGISASCATVPGRRIFPTCASSRCSEVSAT
jgi:hypothetical protein